MPGNNCVGIIGIVGHGEFDVDPPFVTELRQRSIADLRDGTAEQQVELVLLMRELAATMPTVKPDTKPAAHAVAAEVEKFKCVKCGGDVGVDESVVFDAKRYCQTCLGEICGNCSECGDMKLHEDLREGTDGAGYCQSCWDEKFMICSACDAMIRTDEAHEGNSEYYCDECFADHFTECSRCGGVHANDDSTLVPYDDGYFCERCASRYLYYCEHCEEWVDAGSRRTHRDGYVGCESCYDSYCEDEPDGDDGTCQIHAHDYKPAPIYFRTDKDEQTRVAERAYIGFELEVEAIDNSRGEGAEMATSASAIKSRDGAELFYCKDDGSLTNGFEVVSHPMTRRFMFGEKKGAKKVITDVIDGLRRRGFRSYNTDTCGLHFHLSRKFFQGTFHLFKFLKFFYAMDKEFIVSVSGRKSETAMRQYCALTDRDFGDVKGAIIQKARDKHGFQRYQAVNLNNRHTVEVRIFKGTLNVNSFFRKAELMFAAIEFTKASPQQFTTQDFFGWIDVNKNEYPYSYEWLRSKQRIRAIKLEEEVVCA